ncbi:MAG: hypothetical protein EOP06_29430, partial [Proteobacteria bacterium]
MINSVVESFGKTQERIKQISDGGYGQEDLFRVQNAEKFKKAIEETLKPEPAEVQERVLAEYFSYGPLDSLFLDEEVSEILVNGPFAIWYERNGSLHLFEDQFLSEATYTNCFYRLCENSNCQSTVEYPTATGHFKDFRLTVIRQELTRNHHHFSFRRHPKNPWTFKRLQARGWANTMDVENLKQLI